MRAIFPFILGLACVSPAFAAATDWQELAPGARIRLIASETRTADGKTLAALELDMPQNTKTYWRVPGETGIPTKLDLAGSTGITGYQFVWPYPAVEELKGYTDFVYHGPLVLPIELMVEGDKQVIHASVLMGVCSDICVPAMAEFTLPLDLTKPDPGQGLRIDQALALAPIPWNGEGDDPIGEVEFDPEGGVLRIPVDRAAVDPESVIVDASATGHLFGAPQKSPEPGLITLPLLGGDDEGAGLEGQSVQVVFMTGNGPYEVTRRVARSTAAGS